MKWEKVLNPASQKAQVEMSTTAFTYSLSLCSLQRSRLSFCALLPPLHFLYLVTSLLSSFCLTPESQVQFFLA